MPRFRNHYECPCGETWTDEWHSKCDDRCPKCDTSCSPTNSDDKLAKFLPKDGRLEW